VLQWTKKSAEETFREGVRKWEGQKKGDRPDPKRGRCGFLNMAEVKAGIVRGKQGKNTGVVTKRASRTNVEKHVAIVTGAGGGYRSRSS